MKDYSEEILKRDLDLYDINILYYKYTVDPENSLIFSIKKKNYLDERDYISLSQINYFVRDNFCKNNGFTQKEKNSSIIVEDGDDFFEYLDENNIKAVDKYGPYPLDKHVQLKDLSKEDMLKAINIILNYSVKIKAI